ncbi:MAG: 1-aminocyclopropane-1-carboxylate deaminase/D-cysteine desulfhydrase [Flavobacteriales bacterium]
MQFDINSLFRIPSPLQEFSFPSQQPGIRLYVKRDDLIHNQVQGNKWRKLKYNLQQAGRTNKTHMVTMGGPWSNHLAATAAACKLLGFTSEAFVRGEIEEKNLSHTLRNCTRDGMQLKMISKIEYDRLKESDEGMVTSKLADHCYFIPEGGANANGVLGCKDIRHELTESFDYIAAPVGSGTTCAGLALACGGNEKVLCMNVFKSAGQLKEMIAGKIRLLENENDKMQTASNRIHVIDGFSFGGFARVTQELMDFRMSLYKDTGMDTDLVYTSKLFFAVNSLLKDGFLKKGQKIVVLHTGGTQGNQGFQHKMNETDKI